MKHYPGDPIDFAFLPCTHRPTRQRYHVLTEDTTVETIHGTMAARVGDVLVEGANGALYVLTAQSFRDAYDF